MTCIGWLVGADAAGPLVFAQIKKHLQLLVYPKRP